MIQSILILLLGLVLVLIGAEALVSGASDIARKLGISEFVIGLTIVALGTSAPEMVVSFISSAKGNGTMAIGNIVGSNIFNTAFILGLTAIILPIGITRENIKRDIPYNVAVTFLFILLGMSGTIFGLGNDRMSRPVGAIFLLCFAWYIFTAFKNGRNEEEEASVQPSRPFIISLIMTICGLAALIVGGDWFVDGAKEVATLAGLSDKFIAITILAGGTSMPELATCVVAALKGKGQLALGNILGSNTFNILLILGGSALIRPMDMSEMSLVDLGVLAATAIITMLAAFTNKKGKLDRAEGALLVLLEISYMIYLFKM